MSSAPFIVLEALDGVGKSTLVQVLANRFDGVAMDTPGAQLRPLASAILSGLGEQQTARCLFYASSVLACGARGRAYADAGTPVIMDRYWLSTVSYARARGVEMDVDAIERVVPIPDITVLLVLEESERQRRLQERGFTQADLETLSPIFRDTVLCEMRSKRRLHGLRPTFEVDVTGADPEEAGRRVMEALESRLVVTRWHRYNR